MIRYLNFFKYDLSGLGTEEYHNRLYVSSFWMRIFSIAIAVLIAVFLQFYLALDISVMLYTALGGWFMVCLAYIFVFRSGIIKKRAFQENIYLSYYLFGVFFATCTVHYLGGARWISFCFYVMDLLLAVILLSRARSAAVTLLVVAGYSALVTLERFGYIPQAVFPLEKAPYADDRDFFVTQFVIVAWFFILTFCVGISAKMKEEREIALSESRSRLQDKSHQLEEITAVLRKKAAENKYIKNATMGYIAKKEYEIEKSKQELADQVEKLRKNQKSMFFMIEDLNRMSAQLKEARDQLEDKVKQRTDELLSISKKLHRSERLAFLGKLSGSVTHELRNPLAVLKNSAYFLETKLKDDKDEKVRKYLDVIKKELNAIDAIIDDIMGFARTKAPDLNNTNVHDLVENVLSTVMVPELVVVKKELEEVPDILVDGNLILHALTNIVNNAIMAMNGNGTLTLRTFAEGGRAIMEIEDDGPGIPPDQRDLIFEPLYSSKPKGTGLGLPIAKMIVENQDGRIDFDSILGQGTVFRISFPFSRQKG
ncbi:MAG: hypothetical protein GF408_03795 [Candidatus Omnitrophica bacterium]|nr:hypothetical protein [Candidatus Omnitrophota bacterium]